VNACDLLRSPCPRCKSQKSYKAGKYPRTNYQRYHCRKCGKVFGDEYGGPMDGRWHGRRYGNLSYGSTGVEESVAAYLVTVTPFSRSDAIRKLTSDDNK